MWPLNPPAGDVAQLLITNHKSLTKPPPTELPHKISVSSSYHKKKYHRLVANAAYTLRPYPTTRVTQPLHVCDCLKLNGAQNSATSARSSVAPSHCKRLLHLFTRYAHSFVSNFVWGEAVGRVATLRNGPNNLAIPSHCCAAAPHIHIYTAVNLLKLHWKTITMVGWSFHIYTASTNMYTTLQYLKLSTLAKRALSKLRSCINQGHTS